MPLGISTYRGWLSSVKTNATLLLASCIALVVLVFCAAVLLVWGVGVGMGLLMLVNWSLDVLGNHVELFE